MGRPLEPRLGPRYRDVPPAPPGAVTPEVEYDRTLTQRLEHELATWTAATDPAFAALKSTLDRIETRLRNLLSGHDLERALAFLRPPTFGESAAGGSSALPHDPAARSLKQMLGMSRELDGVDDPVQGLTLGERVARRTHEVARALEPILEALDGGEAIATAWRRLLAYASELVKNAVTRIREFAVRIGVTSVAITLSSVPPEFSVTFTFGGPSR